MKNGQPHAHNIYLVFARCSVYYRWQGAVSAVLLSISILYLVDSKAPCRRVLYCRLQCVKSFSRDDADDQVEMQCIYAACSASAIMPPCRFSCLFGARHRPINHVRIPILASCFASSTTPPPPRSLPSSLPLPGEEGCTHPSGQTRATPVSEACRRQGIIVH